MVVGNDSVVDLPNTDNAGNLTRIANELCPLENTSLTLQPGSSTLALTYDDVDPLTRAGGSK